MSTTSAFSAHLIRFPAQQPLIAVPIYNAYTEVIECISALCATLPSETPVLLIDDASTDQRISGLLQSLHDPRIFIMTKPHNSGFVDSVNIALQAAERRDVVLVNSDVIVPSGWLERLRDAAYVRSNIATATPFSNNGAILSVPTRNCPQPDLPPGWQLSTADQAIQAASQRLRPVIPTAIGYCTYIRRSALDSIGLFDTAFSPGYGEEVDFCQRAVQYGFIHVAADDLLVFHYGSRSFNQRGQEHKRRIQHDHDALIAKRYPWYYQSVAQVVSADDTPLANALGQASRALRHLRIAIDATCLNGATSGTQVATLAFIEAMAQRPVPCSLTLILADTQQMAVLGTLATRVEAIITPDQISHQNNLRFDLVVRPYQIYDPHELAFLRQIAERLIFFHLDSIRYANPSYWPHAAAWQRYRQLTRLAFALADAVGFNSIDAAQDADLHGLRMAAERSCIMYQGVDHQPPIQQQAVLPSSLVGLDQRPFLLMLGANYRHKNRQFGLHLLIELIANYHWNGDLVLAGPVAPIAGSDRDEAAIIRDHPHVADRVHDLGSVSDSAKHWLLEHAALVLYPSIIEGFGFIPFEAAAAGVPVLVTQADALHEVLGDLDGMLNTFDPHHGAQVAWQLLNEQGTAAKQIAQIRDRAAQYTWRAVAERTMQLYHQLTALPLRTQEYGLLDEHELRMLIESSYTRTPLPYAPQQPKSVQLLVRWHRYATNIIRIIQLAGPMAIAHMVYRSIRWRITASKARE